MPFVPKPPFPDVPQLPGVAQLARSGLAPAAPPPVLGVAAAAAALWQQFAAETVWGVFSEDTRGNLVLVLDADSVLDFGYKKESSVSSFPVQAGAFASYNKVATPFEVSVRLSKSGTEAERAVFLETLESVASSLNTYVVMTPERMYTNVNVTRYEVTRRGAKGAYFLTDVDLFFVQIREVQAAYSTTASATANAQDPSAEPATNLGKVQSSDPPAGVTFDPAANVGVNP